MFEPLDTLLLSQYRLSIMCILKKGGSLDFTELKKIINISSGNLSLQLTKLKLAGYIDVNKQFKGNYPLTICRVTDKGKDALNVFFKAINTYQNLDLQEWGSKNNQSPLH